MPEPSSLPQDHARTGLKARLVVHKLVNVNFRSYARRQEIGPFHKVSFRSIIVSGLDYTHDPSSYFLLSSDLTDQTNLTSLIPCFSSLVIAPQKCAKPNSLNSSTTLLDTQSSAIVA